MNIEISYHNGYYYWNLYDGPDGVDHYSGSRDCLGKVFEEIIQTRLNNAKLY